MKPIIRERNNSIRRDRDEMRAKRLSMDKCLELLVVKYAQWKLKEDTIRGIITNRFYGMSPEERLKEKARHTTA